MIELLDVHGYKQHVESATHRSGHVIDWVICACNIVQNVEITDQQMSDHFLVKFDLQFKKPNSSAKTVTFRNFKTVDTDIFSYDYIEHHSDSFSSGDVDTMVCEFNKTLASVTDKHAPVKTKVVRPRTPSPWYNSEIREAKGKRRAAERQWRKTTLEIHKQIFNACRHSVNNLIRKAKADYINAELTSNSGNPQRLFSILHGLLGKESEVVLPHGEDAHLASEFNTYFLDKITNIRKQFDPDVELESSASCTSSQFDSFRPVTTCEVRRTILDAKPTSCSLDPVPTKFLLKVLDALLPAITDIMNASLSTGVVPDYFKKAVVKPLLKKSNLDPQLFKNYRPVSNLSFLSKILEKLVKKQLLDHLTSNDLLHKYQSAYRQANSTETALNCVLNDVRMSVDKGNIAMLVLLDLSSAFDTIDHEILLQRLQNNFCISGAALQWFASYITNRTQAVAIGNESSTPVTLLCGVPQGSVLGPMLFTLYTTPLGQRIERHRTPHHFYADDSQVQNSFLPTPASESGAKQNMELCIADIGSWMDKNKLKLNSDKTEAILFGPPSRLKKCSLNHLSIGSADITFKPSVKNLGVFLDPSLSMEDHVSHCCKISHYHLRNISAIRHLLTKDATATLVRSLIFSRIDYCNSLLYGITDQQMRRLQHIQNYAARLVTRTSIKAHITPVLNSLHWLRIPERITFKILSLAYQAVNEIGPSYLSDLTVPYCPSRTLRSSQQHLLEVPPTKLKTFGARSFTVSASSLWNSLPFSLRSSPSLATFKTNLKTYLFQQYN